MIIEIFIKWQEKNNKTLYLSTYNIWFLKPKTKYTNNYIIYMNDIHIVLQVKLDQKSLIFIQFLKILI